MADEYRSQNSRPVRLSPEELSLLEARINLAFAGANQRDIIPRSGQQGEIPLSYAQEGLWALSMINTENAFANNPILVRFQGKLDLEALNRALKSLLKRQDALCYCIRGDLGHPAQQFIPVTNFELPVVDFGGIFENEAQLKMDEWIRSEIDRPIDISNSPLMRANLLRTAEDDHLLLMVFHHLVMDGWSKGIALAELGEIYSAGVEQRSAALVELPIRYADYTAWQRARMDSPAMQKQLNFWKSYLRNLPPAFEIPPDHPLQRTCPCPTGSAGFELNDETINGLQKVGAKYDATLAMALLTCFLVLLRRFSGQSDIVIGLPIAGRTVLQTENLIGLFINTLAFRIELPEDQSFWEALRAVRQEAERVYSNQEVPLEKLVSVLPHKRDPNRPPFFQMLFNFKNFPKREIRFAGMEASVMPVQPGVSRYDLSLELEWDGARIQATFIYNAALYERETISDLAESYQVLLEKAIQYPERKIAAFGS